MAVNWSYYDKFNGIIDQYMPFTGEGETKASQIVTAVNKLIYKWYNDGDVFDNSYTLEGWANDLSSYANWLYEYTDADGVLNNIKFCYSESDYEDLLKALADKLLNEKYLAVQDKEKKTGSIYECDGKFKWVDIHDDDYDYDEDEDYEDDDEY